MSTETKDVPLSDAGLPAKTARPLATLSAQGGGIVFNTVSEARDVAFLMASSDKAVRKHLRNNPGACFGIVIQAVEWGLSPYAVANKSYEVNDQLAYESQLIQAVILRRAPIKGRIKFAFEGEGQDRVCIASATDLSDDRVEYRSPKLKDIKPKNSPLWTNDPDQQLSYFSGRSLCRRHFPDVLMGIYDVDELEGSAGMKTVGQQQTQPSGFAERLSGGGNNGFNPTGVDEAINGTEAIDPATVDWNNGEQAAAAVRSGIVPEGYKLDDGRVLIVPDAMAKSKLKGHSIIAALFDEVRTVGGKVLKTKAPDEPDPEIVRAGATALVDGLDRQIPDDLELTDQQARWWFEGYDQAKQASEQS